MNEKFARATIDERPSQQQRLPSDQFQRELIALIPQLRAFSRLLCRRKPIAEDLAQEALAKAWRARDRFEPGTNMKAWLFTILRNAFYTQVRRGWRETSWDAEKGEAIPTPGGEQEWSMDLSDTARALNGLPDKQREAILLVGVAGLTYDDAGRVCHTPAGTMKSRVARGRTCLVNILDGSQPIPQRPLARSHHASDNILAQMSAVMGAGERGVATHA